ncbi:ROK family protein [Photobacterium lutimaris]|uniref:ROK family protein n=1 Tax=Photobacterium lutimaris TaxID=388278 RepID=A0A2T3IYE6_9GAMM|nr:ROK family protein [Photobacterium lutimaris]PSU33615.1 ROK family protein [Photobacterium lutimaris]TDR74538.1 transcriptional regulator [Photobacterium lutimaris]
MTTQHFLVLDIGGSAVKYAVMDSAATLLRKGKFTSPKASLDDFWLALDRVVLPLRQQYTLSGIAISACGAVDCNSGVIHGASALPYIHGPNFKSIIYERYQLPAELENDACCAALAELWQGSAQHITNCCLMVIGSGIGGAIVNNRQIQHGHQLYGGEFGYMITGEKNGRPVTFSDMASTRALVEMAAEKIDVEEESLNGKMVFDAADNGDVRLEAVVEQWFRTLATGLFNIQYCIDPETIILGGAVSERPDLLEHLNRHLDELIQVIPIASIKPKLATCQAGNDANLIGALFHFLQRQA